MRAFFLLSIYDLFILIFLYLSRQSNETRSSSLDSDGEYEGPPILRTISHDEQTTTTTSQTTPGALRKVRSQFTDECIAQWQFQPHFPCPASQPAQRCHSVVCANHFPIPIIIILLVVVAPIPS